jgi:serine protease Do
MVARRVTAARLGSLLVVTLLLIGCGAAATPAPSAAPGTTAQSSDGPLASALPASLVTTLDGVQAAAIQIEAQGTFVDPGEGEVTGAGRGSGVIIDPSGIAVTNNHVVTGAALLKVWIGGDPARTYNAKVLGVSECSDLAVIDIEGDGFPYMGWYGEKPKVGLDVYLAGFPLGEPQYTLNRGIVAKADAPGDTDWASVDSVIQHDAQSNPGNSGGPLVTANGQIVAIHFAGRTDAHQSFAIGVTEVNRVLSDLQAGKDVTSIGVNGRAFSGDEGTTGTWVASVASGSPADKAGVKPGDLITRLEGLPLAADGTMGDYCDILRSHEPTDELKIQVLRPSTGEVLEGRLNGTALAVVQALGSNAEPTLAASPGASPGPSEAPAGYDFVAVSEADGRMAAELPSAWSDTENGDWTRDDAPVGAFIGASTDYAAWVDGYTVPGIFLGVSTQYADRSVAAELDEQKGAFADDCTYESREDFDAYGYVGQFDIYRSCGGTQNSFFVVVVKPADGGYLVLAQVVVLADRDLNATDRAIQTLKVSMP